MDFVQIPVVEEDWSPGTWSVQGGQRLSTVRRQSLLMSVTSHACWTLVEVSDVDVFYYHPVWKHACMGAI